MINILPAFFGALALLVATLLTACSGGGGTPDNQISIVNNNTANNNSGNGEAECTFECEPVELAGSAGFAVTQVCSGVIQNGPNFFQAPPVGCTFLPGEGEVAQVDEESIGLNQEGVL